MKIIVLESNVSRREQLNTGLKDLCKTISFHNSFDEVFPCVKKGDFVVALIGADFWLDSSSGRKLPQLRQFVDIILLAYNNTSAAEKTLVNKELYDFVDYPWDLGCIKALIEKAIEKYVFKPALRKNTGGNQPIIGHSKAMKAVNEFIAKVADSTLPVLIEGESGTGKEIAANALHSNSYRAKNAFIPVNCGALPKDLLENELFGHEIGAFTGATSIKRGLFEIADGGTLFIDEITEMDMSAQSRLLRVLETGAFRRLGGTKEVTVNVRIVAATNKVIENEIEKNRFRTDLYYRLNALRIFMPSLNKRKEDIPLFVEHFIQRTNTGGNKKIVSPGFMDAVMSFNWPGNVRELYNVIHSAVVMSVDRKELSEKDLPKYITDFNKMDNPCGAGAKEMNMAEFVAAAERKYLKEMLDKYGENKCEMAQKLRISRAKLYRKLSKYKLV